MSTKVHHMPTLSGLREFRDLLDLVRNEVKYSGLLDELVEARKSAEAAIELLGRADQIEPLLATAKGKKLEAEASISKATLEALEILKSAKTEALRITRGASASIESKITTLNSKVADASKLVEASQRAMADLERKLSLVEARELKVTIDEGLVVTLKARYDDKMAKLKAIAKG